MPSPLALLSFGDVNPGSVTFPCTCSGTATPPHGDGMSVPATTRSVGVFPPFLWGVPRNGDAVPVCVTAHFPCEKRCYGTMRP